MHICMNLEEKLLSRLAAMKDNRGEISALVRASGVDQGSISRALKPREKKPQDIGLSKVSQILDAMGARVIFPDEIPSAAPVSQPVSTECQNCEVLKEEIKRLTFKIEGMVELASAQAAAQSKAEVDQRPPLQALAKGQSS